MRYLKIYEDFNEPKVGDYVLMRTDSKNIGYGNFLRNTPGQIVEISKYLVTVKYENITYELRKLKIFKWNSLEQEYIHTFNRKKILVFSDTPDDLELKIDTNKYNI